MFWIKEIFLQNSVLGILMLLCSICLVLCYFVKKSMYLWIFLVLFCSLIFFQVKTTDFKYGYKLLPSEIDLQTKRMNMFPPKLARLGYILEFKKETMFLNKLQNNFFDILDFKLYFGNYFSFFSIPFFFVGLFYFLKNGRKFLQILLTVAVAILSLLGKNGKYGPFLIFPYFFLFIVIGFFNAVKYLKK